MIGRARNAAAAWLEEGRWVRRTAPAWVYAGWVGATIAGVIAAGALVVSAIAGAISFLR